MNVTASLLMGIYIVFDLLVSELMLVNLLVANKWSVALVDSLDKQTYKLNLTTSVSSVEAKVILKSGGLEPLEV